MGTGASPPADAARARRLLREALRLSEEGQVAAGVQACLQALAHHPYSAEAHSLLGMLYERQGRQEAAIQEYEIVLRVSPHSPAERQRLAELRGDAKPKEEVWGEPQEVTAAR